MGKHAVYTTEKVEAGLFTTEKYMMHPPEFHTKEVTCPYCKKRTFVTNEHANWCTNCGEPLSYSQFALERKGN